MPNNRSADTLQLIMTALSSTSVPSTEGPARRRKVRKGTRSCWECKRRKIRCLFASSEDAVCTSCRRRRTHCVSQELPEDLAPAKKGSRHLGERISQVEDLMKSLLAKETNGTVPRPEPWPEHHSCASRAPFTPAESFEDPSPSSLATPASPATAAAVVLSPDSVDPAVHHLLAAFPDAEDVQILLRESVRPSLYTELTNTQPHRWLTIETLETLAAAAPPARLPGPDTHPVLLAKCMLTFAITMQCPCGDALDALSEPPDVLMRRLVSAATTWVTARDDFHGMLECLICMMLEAVFEVNSGQLRRAWAAYRRAMTAAQLMGLHRSPPPPLKRLDPAARPASPEFMWFRIVSMDRYLSLLLGLPQGTSDKSMGAPETWRHEPPLGQFERLLAVAASRILERNEQHPFSAGDMATTQSIDAELLSVAKHMPASFWRPAHFSHLTPGSPHALLETVRLAAQVYYYGLLIQLHLPYMMAVAAAGTQAEHEYAKITCINAGREIMARFVAHRTFNPMSSCSRPVDFFALLAAMTLLLAHLDVHGRCDVAATTATTATTATPTTNILAHQRLSDRALVDQAAECMETISRKNRDDVTGESAKLIRRLLDIEAAAAAAAEGGSCAASSTGLDNDELRLDIPYLGVVKIARQGLTLAVPADAGGQHGVASEPAEDQPILPGGDTGMQENMADPGLVGSPNDWAFQGVDMAFFDSITRGPFSLGDAVDLEPPWPMDI